MIRFVRMREPGEAPGLEQERHGVPVPNSDKTWLFKAGLWEAKELTDAHADFLRRYKNRSNARLFDVADNEAEMLKIIADRRRAMAEAKAKASPALASGGEGVAGTDEDVVLMAHAKFAAERVPVPRPASPEEQAAAEAESAAKAAAEAKEAGEADEAAPEPDITESDHEAEMRRMQEAQAVISSYAGSEAAEAATHMFQADLPRVVREEPEKLRDIDGIGPRTVEKITEAIENAG